jgi:hypothetical protein
VSPRVSRWVALAVVSLALVLCFALPRFAATVVRGEIERESRADRAAFASGHSPWAWRFHQADDVVAGRAFGAARLDATDTGLAIRATDDRGFEIGLPLRRDADLVQLDTLSLDATASAPGRYSLSVREALTGPIRRADLGMVAPADVARPLRIDRLAWTDERGHPIAAPRRAAMLRLGARLPAGASLILASAHLSLAGVPALPPATVIPGGLTAEALLAWRDRQLERDPLAGFVRAGPANVDPPTDSYVAPSWRPWLAPALYLLLLGVTALVRRAYAAPPAMHVVTRDEASSLRRQDVGNAWQHRFPVVDAGLVMAGPLWFIVGLGLSQRPSPPGVAVFGIGVIYALLLAARHRLPRWRWFGAWQSAVWPLLALVVALAVALVGGHPPVWPTPGRALLYIGWAFFQQWLMLAVVAALLARTLPRPAAVLGTALVFALLHTPNGLLMQLCFVAELGWAWWYLKHRALLPVALAHAASAVLLQACVAGGVLRSLEVSARFLN